VSDYEIYEKCKVKVLYIDGDNHRVFHGRIRVIDEYFIEFIYPDGTPMLVNKKNIEKVIPKNV